MRDFTLGGGDDSALPEVAQPLAREDPRTVGPFRILALLGRGGMGNVYLARSPTGRLVAVKLIREEYGSDPDFRRMFEREIQLAKRVARFSTAEVLDHGTVAGRPYMVTEFVDGPTLTAAVRENGPLDGGRLERLAIAVATALAAIHAAGTVHRDLKPSNVMLTPSGPVVIDFGIALAVDSLTTTATSIVGTPSFMAPEQALGARVGPAADVYAWGGIVVYAATGRPPFGDGLPHMLLYRIVYEDPDLDGVPQPLRDLVARAMHREPRDRPTARDLVSLLLSIGHSDHQQRPPTIPHSQDSGSGISALPGGPSATAGRSDTLPEAFVLEGSVGSDDRRPVSDDRPEPPGRPGPLVAAGSGSKRPGQATWGGIAEPAGRHFHDLHPSARSVPSRLAPKFPDIARRQHDGHPATRSTPRRLTTPEDLLTSD
jgi:serine/threonine protein kinase